MSNSLNIFDTKSSNFIRHNGFSRVQTKQAPIHPHAVWFQFTTVSAGCSNISKTLFTVFPAIMQYLSSAVFAASVQRVPEPDPIPGISFDTRPDPIHF